MENNELIAVENRIVTKFMDMFIKFGMLLALASFCYTIFSPFLNIMLWAVILAVVIYPFHQRIAKRLSDKQGRAATLLIVIGLMILVLPTIMMVSSMTDNMGSLVERVNQNTLEVPTPKESIANIPFVGAKIYDFWLKASTDLPSLVKSLQPHLGDAAKQVIHALASISASLLMSMFSFIIAGIMMAYGHAGAQSSARIATRIAGPERGAKLVNICSSTIRAVALGVIGVAFIQALLIGIVMTFAGIPLVGIFFILVLILGIAQIPALLVTLPAIAYIWMAGDNGTVGSIIYTVLLILAGAVDNVLKPIFLGRGVDAPMPVVLIGALGGMATSGILGMFIGATLLSIGYRIFMMWVDEGLEEGLREQDGN
ncbi:AI-2E family transporter [Shewanella mangrovisoli]|uniref:AI-2E family transporter n=1 Tax=Shewanella mangrovisoli TaxID=2864211 RepID=A0ABV4VDR9_9GAMM